MLKITVSDVCSIIRTIECLKKSRISKDEIWRFILYNMEEFLSNEYMQQNGKRVIRWFEQVINFVYSHN